MAWIWNSVVASVSKNLLIVFLGALLGSVLRLVSEGGVRWVLATEPAYNLLVVNAVGCAAFGYCAVVIRSQQTKLFWLTGCWGAYTSFSAVSLVFLLMGLSLSQVCFYTALTAFSWGMSFDVGQRLGRIARS